MCQPTVTVRRHNSLPGRLRRSEPVLRRMSQQMKFNPYVGWFRHSPDSGGTSSSTTTVTAKEQTASAVTQPRFVQQPGFWGNAKTTTMMRSFEASPYVGFFRHSPAAAAVTTIWSAFVDNDDVSLALPTLLQKVSSGGSGASYDRCVQELADFLAGRLRGGSPSWYHHHPHRYSHRRNNKSFSYSRSNISSQSSISALALLNSRTLTRIAGWVLSPFLESLEDDKEDAGSLQSLDNDSTTSSLNEGEETWGHDDDNEEREQENVGHDQQQQHSSSSSLIHQSQFEQQRQRYLARSSSSMGTSSTSATAAHMAVSSQAEAYYAHQAANDLNPDEQMMPSRLDYVITQMDIIRMQRNASRHLDVESICQLPTTTYQKNKPKDSDDREQDRQDEDHLQDQQDSEFRNLDSSKSTASEGWMIVSRASSSSGQQADEQQASSSSSPPPSSSHSTYKDELEIVPSASCCASQNAVVQEDDTCVICLEQFVYGDRLRILPCGHRFHMGCIDRWLSGSASFDECHTAGCPTCKKHPVLREGGDEEKASSQGEDAAAHDDESLRADGSVPSWAFARLGSALLARDSQQF